MRNKITVIGADHVGGEIEREAFHASALAVKEPVEMIPAPTG